MRLDPGAEFAGFTIERTLGNGGMGIVYLARNPRLNRLVALKVLGELIAADTRGRARFEREAALAARLEHPNIVTIYDRAPSDAVVPWICMKYIGGGDVAQRMSERGGPLPDDQAVGILTDAARALDYAHRHGILHRDVKPGNILLDHTAGDLAVLTDFGIARALDDTLTLTGTAATFAYAAPERFHGATADHRADIYSLGCTFYELLATLPPATDARPSPPPRLTPPRRHESRSGRTDSADPHLPIEQTSPADPGAAGRAEPRRSQGSQDAPEATDTAALPDSIRVGLDSPHPEIRRGAVQALSTHLSSRDDSQVAVARKALHHIVTHDSPAVASYAREILGGAATMDSPRLPGDRRGRGVPGRVGTFTEAPGLPDTGSTSRDESRSGTVVSDDVVGVSETPEKAPSQRPRQGAGHDPVLAGWRGRLTGVLTVLSGVSAVVAGGVLLDSSHMPFADPTNYTLDFIRFDDLLAHGSFYLNAVTWISAVRGC
ncbi:protein kinase [Nocardia tengchongensis]|uniref:protein kinase domain-containing protein n=1 Tax=Nocardia tengchongensis TaxID=2055889 RepID=UPI0036BDA56F